MAPRPPPTITTPRLQLTLLTEATLTPALQDLHELRTFESVMVWTRTGVIDASLDATRDWCRARMSTPGCEQYLVQLPLASAASQSPTSTPSETQAPNGLQNIHTYKTIGVLGVVTAPEVGYLINPHYQGKGYATEALEHFVGAFWDFVKVEGHPAAYAAAEIDATNGGSRRVLQKCGFQLVVEAVDGAINVEKYALPRPGTVLPEIKTIRGKHEAKKSERGAGIV